MKTVAHHPDLFGIVTETGDGYSLVDNGIEDKFETIQEALAAWADLNLTQIDCEAWHRGALTKKTFALVEVIVVALQFHLEIWGSPNGRETLWVIVR